MGGVTGIVTKPVEGTCSSAVKPTLLLQTLSLGVKGKKESRETLLDGDRQNVTMNVEPSFIQCAHMSSVNICKLVQIYSRYEL